MRPTDLGLEFARINNCLPLERPDYSRGWDLETTDGYLKSMARFLDRQISRGASEAAARYSNELLTLCNPELTSHYENDNLLFLEAPKITVFEGNIGDFGARKVSATLDAHFKKDEVIGRLPGLYDSSALVDGKYRIWVGIDYDGQDDPLQKYLESFRGNDGWAENCLDIVRLEIDSKKRERAIDSDFLYWLQLMYDRASNPVNAPDLYSMVPDRKNEI